MLTHACSSPRLHSHLLLLCFPAEHTTFWAFSLPGLFEITAANGFNLGENDPGGGRLCSLDAGMLLENGIFNGRVSWGGINRTVITHTHRHSAFTRSWAGRLLLQAKGRWAWSTLHGHRGDRANAFLLITVNGERSTCWPLPFKEAFCSFFSVDTHVSHRARNKCTTWGKRRRGAICSGPENPLISFIFLRALCLSVVELQ